MTVYIAAVSFGLGDLVVSLPAIDGLLKIFPTVTLVSRSSLQDEVAQRIDGLAAVISEQEFEAKPLKSEDVYYNLREHPLQKNYWWGSEAFEHDYPGLQINDILKVICEDQGIKADFNNVSSLLYNERLEFSTTVIFLPGSDGTYKCWPLRHWLLLFSELKTRGINSLMLGQPDCSREVAALVEAGIPWLPTASVAEAIDILSNCLAVVGVDTGLTHVAVQQKRPTVGLYRDKSIYVRNYPNCAPLYAPECHAECITRSCGCANNISTSLANVIPRTWTCAMTDQQSCMSQIAPTQVLESLHTMLEINSSCK